MTGVRDPPQRAMLFKEEVDICGSLLLCGQEKAQRPPGEYVLVCLLFSGIYPTCADLSPGSRPGPAEIGSPEPAGLVATATPLC